MALRDSGSGEVIPPAAQTDALPVQPHRAERVRELLSVGLVSL